MPMKSAGQADLVLADAATPPKGGPSDAAVVGPEFLIACLMRSGYRELLPAKPKQTLLEALGAMN